MSFQSTLNVQRFEPSPANASTGDDTSIPCVRIVYSLCDTILTGHDWEQAILRLPESVRAHAARFVREKDRQSSLLGKLLLLRCMELLNIPQAAIYRWRTDNHGKPTVGDEVFFNISHTDGCVVCAATSTRTAIGVDVENIRPVNPSEFVDCLGEDTVGDILRSPRPLARFHHFWTAQESALKADGRGFLVDLNDVFHDASAETVCVEGRPWHVLPIDIAPFVCCCLATAHPIVSTFVERYYPPGALL